MLSDGLRRGRAHIEVLLAPVDDSETLVTLNGNASGLPGVKYELQGKMLLVAQAIEGAIERTADSGSAGQSKATSEPIEQLRQLSELRDAGVLTDEEFEAKKADILGRI